MKNTNRPPKQLALLIFLKAAGLAILVTGVTISYMLEAETNKIIIALAINLIVSSFLMVIISIMGESFIEDIIKALIISFLGYMIWTNNVGGTGLSNSLSLSVFIAAWYPVIMKMLFGNNS